MNISNNDIQNAVNFYRDLKKKSDEAPIDENLQATYGAGRVLSMIGIDIDNLDKPYHCPVCGFHYGKSFIHDDSDPECPRCDWMGKY